MRQLSLFDDLPAEPVAAVPIKQPLYAVDLAGLTHYAGTPMMLLISPVIPNRQTVQVEKGIAAGGIGVVLECDEARARAIVEVAGKLALANGAVLYFYRSTTGNTWERAK